VSQEEKAGCAQALANIAHEQVLHLCTSCLSDECGHLCVGIRHQSVMTYWPASWRAADYQSLTLQVTEEYKRMTAAMEDSSKRGSVYVQPWKQ
jgi:hypothetical protein